ncbi:MULTISPECIES: DnaD domain-containing protein [Bacillus]|uniref:DnaD domain-containing protein n=1 Tax=Bacillus TaxID=1386 RepID=UPI000BB6848D|nr:MULTISPECIES: DnaD domain-containing protein [Bacillus]
MKKDHFIEFLEEGNLSIPNYLLNNYVQLGLNETELMIIIHVHAYVEAGVVFPTPEEIAEKMTINETQCMEHLRQLLKKGYLAITDQMDENIIKYECYSLRPLWEKMIYFMMNESNQQQKVELEVNEKSLYNIFEKEFGRPLSPLECETLAIWIDQDHYDAEIIKAALREAVLSGKLNFRYIDRILFEWKKNGVKTIVQAREYSKKFRKAPAKNAQQTPQKNEPSSNTVPFYNWLD